MRGLATFLAFAIGLAVVHAEGDPEGTALGVTTRVFGSAVANQFSFETIPADPETGHDVFEIDYDSDHKVVIVRGNTGVAMSSGVYAYMKDELNAVVAWGVNGSGTRFDAPPSSGLPVPAASRTVRVMAWSYSWNVCTFGYTAWAWDWARWEEELDWMALHGVNLPLAFAGQEAVWAQLWTEIGITRADLDQWFTGGAFEPWGRMANIMGWAGPLDNDWIEAHKDLQVQIIGRMVAMGMSPVLAGFPGHVPPAFARIYPNASLTSTAAWGNFNDTYTVVPFLEPDDPLFQPLARRFYQITKEIYGDDVHFFNADQFNEMRPRSSNLTFLEEANAAVWQPMVSVDPNATFVMQAWLFHDQAFWTPTAVEAYLSAVPNGRMLILDLNSEEDPLWQKYNSYYGHDWIWCALHNYGGKPGMYGNLTRVATGPPSVLDQMSNATIRGTGFTPEAILQNPVYYELVTQMTWESKAVDPAAFVVDWARRRYGADSPIATNMWKLLEQTIYKTEFSWSKFSELQEVPSATASSVWDLNGTASVEGIRMLMEAAVSGEVDPTTGPYNHDAVDLGHQAIGFMFADMTNYVRAMFEQYTGTGKVDVTADITPVITKMIQLISDMDSLLATDPSFLMGHWIKQAITSPGASTPDEIANRLFNAKNQVTLWGPSGQINDYAAKHWSGLVKSYYGERWSNWTSYILDVMAKGETYDENLAHANAIAIGQDWDASQAVFPDQTSGVAAIDVLKSLNETYFAASADVKSQFTAMPGVDYSGNDLFQSGTKDVDQLMLLCNSMPACAGFNVPGGYMKLKATTSEPVVGSTFYKRTMPQN